MYLLNEELARQRSIDLHREAAARTRVVRVRSAARWSRRAERAERAADRAAQRARLAAAALP